MRAVRLRAPYQFDAIADAPVPEPASGQVSVRLAVAAICGSDLPKVRSTADRRSGRYGFPIHECVGHIVDQGDHPDLVPGQRVLAMPTDDCGMAEIYLAHHEASHRIDAHHLTDAQATLIQPLATVLYAINKLRDLTDTHAVVIGLGPIGLLCAHVLTQRGAHVTGIDPIGRTSDLAAAFGLTDHLRDASAAWPTHRTHALPVDLCIEAVGHQQQTLRDAISITRHSGTILAMGVPDEPEYVIPFETLMRKNITLITSITPPWSAWFGPAEDYLCHHLGTLSLLLTHDYPITSASLAFQTYAVPAPDRLKVLLTSWASDPQSDENQS